MISRSNLVAVACLVGLAGCAEGDNLFGDAGAALSGDYDRRLVSQRQRVSAEQSRTDVLEAENRKNKQLSDALDEKIKQERSKVAALRERSERLDRDIRSLQAATAEAEVERDKLGRELAEVRGEIDKVEQGLGGTSSAAELERLKTRKAELDKRLSKLAELYQALL